MACLDPISREVACRRLGSAEALARVELETALAEPGARLAIASATRQLAEILIADDRANEASPHVYEARRRYRPFRVDRKLAGEVDLLLATYAFQDERSGDGQEILEEVLTSCAHDPAARLVWARGKRIEAHLAVMRFDFEGAREPIAQAVHATEEKLDPTLETERLLLRSQYLFTSGEIAFLAHDPARSRAFTESAWSFTEMNFADEPEYLAFARERTRHAYEIIDASAEGEGAQGADRTEGA